jgi:hypothetical protein
VPRTEGGEGARLTVAQLARMLDHRLHLESHDADSLARSVRLAVENGVGAITSRPGDVGAVAAQVRQHAPDLGARWRTPGQRGVLPPSRAPLIGVGTALEFERRAPSVAALLEETRDLTLAGATELALFVDEDRLPLPRAGNGVALTGRLPALARSGPLGWHAAVTVLVEAQPRYQFRLRVHLDTSAMTDDALRRACESLREAGVWMVQAGTWSGPRTSFHQIRVMREALGEGTRLKWTSPVPSLHGLLLAIAEGVDRCSAEDTFALLRAAEERARFGPIGVPRPGLDP